MELVWNDLVAPEAAIDTDAKHVSGGQAFVAFLAGLGFFVCTYLYVVWTDPASRAPIAPRAAVLNEKAYLADMGLIDASEVEE
ncbi:hypothetical protein EON65_02635 [archaeon]|nr:MAG: hypothetical protein EON65_02635 [archaeon]